MKAIPGFSNYYVTQDGRVWSVPRPRVRGQWLKQQPVGCGYLTVCLCKNSKVVRRYVHHLVLESFGPLRPPNTECLHINGIRTDNRINNLRWGTKSENSIDAIRHGVHPTVKLTEQQVRQIIYVYCTELFTQREIAEQFGVNPPVVNAIVRGRSWQHISKFRKDNK